MAETQVTAVASEALVTTRRIQRALIWPFYWLFRLVFPVYLLILYILFLIPLFILFLLLCVWTGWRWARTAMKPIDHQTE